MKDYFIKLMIETVDVIRDMTDSRQFEQQLGNIESIEGSTLLLDNGADITVVENDNTINISYLNNNNGIRSSVSCMWADYAADTKSFIRKLLIDVSEKERDNTRTISEKIRQILITGLNLKDQDILEHEEPQILKFINDGDEVQITIYNDSLLSLYTNVFHMQVPLSKIDGPEILIEGVVKPYLNMYNLFYK